MPWSGPWGGSAPPDVPAGPCLPALDYLFAGPVAPPHLTITVMEMGSGAGVPGVISYDPTTLRATFKPAAGALMAGAVYQACVSGAAAADGTPMEPDTSLLVPSA